MPRTITSTFLALALILSSTTAQATLLHSDVMGTTVVYTGIEESSPTGDPLPLYGQPAANGDELLFPTTGNFASLSVDGGPSDSTDGKLSVTVMAKPTFVIDAIEISEGGLTTLNAPFGGDSFTEAVSFAIVKVLEISNSPVSLPAFPVFLTISPLGGQYQLSVIGGSSYATGWDGVANIPLPLNTTKVDLVLNNNLFAATTGQGTRAFMDKKDFEIDVDTHVVPEPATVALGLSAFVGLFLVRSSRKVFASSDRGL